MLYFITLKIPCRAVRDRIDRCHRDRHTRRIRAADIRPCRFDRSRFANIPDAVGVPLAAVQHECICSKIRWIGCMGTIWIIARFSTHNELSRPAAGPGFVPDTFRVRTPAASDPQAPPAAPGSGFDLRSPVPVASASQRAHRDPRISWQRSGDCRAVHCSLRWCHACLPGRPLQLRRNSLRTCSAGF